jgi:dihydrofolate reductase
VKLSLIAAVARNGAIGRDNELLWKESADQKHFAATTRGHAVIMGRRTWESLPPRFRPLPGRRNIVVTHNAHFDAPGAEVEPSLDAALALLAAAPCAFVIGGAQLYAQALPRAQRLLLTELDRDFDGDAHFPAWPRGEFVESSRTHHESVQGCSYQRADYRRKG